MTAPRLSYLGHAAVVIQNRAGRHALFDPWLTGNSHGDVDLESLPPIDLICVTHGGFDHLGDTFDLLRRTGAMLFSSVDVVFAARRLGIPSEQTFPMVSGARRSHAGFEVQAVEAHHVSLTVLPDTYITGQPLSFIVWPDGEEQGASVYHLGDTSIFGDLRLFGELYKPELALIGIGGDPNLPHEMNAREAAMAVEMIGVKAAIPIHFHPGSGDDEQFRDAVSSRGSEIAVRLLRQWDAIDLPVTEP